MGADKKKYIRVSNGFTKSVLIPQDEDFYTTIIAKNPDNDHYRSLYYYDQEHYDNFKKTKSVKGTTGLKTNRIVFDLDSKADVEIARQQAIELCSRLTLAGIAEDKIQVYFSGNKGFHVELETTDEFTRPQYENVLKNFAGDLSTLDMKVTDDQRIFRVPLTRHQVTGLYKIPLTFHQLSKNPIDVIAEQARTINDEHREMIQRHLEVILPESITKLKNVIPIGSQPQVKPNLNFDETLDVARKPKWLSASRYALQEGFFKHGDRNEAFMILAATYRNNGFDDVMAYHMLKGVAEKQAVRNNENQKDNNYLWNNIIKTVYDASWKGGQYTETNDLLIRTRKSLGLDEVKDDNSTNIISISELQERFVSYAQHSDKNTIKLGIKEIDDQIVMTTGMFVTVLGSPSSGKTTLAYKISESVSKNDDLVLFQSMDMGEAGVYSRLLGKYTDESLKTSLKKILDDNVDEVMTKGFQHVAEDYKNVVFDFRGGLNVEEIEQNIIATELKYGKKVRVMILDYLEKIVSPFQDATAGASFVAGRLADLAKKYQLCLICLVQPQKAAGDPREPILTYRSIKGSSRIEQDSRLVFSVWRPGFDPRDNSSDNFMSIAILKNNSGQCGQWDFRWSGLRGTIESMTDVDKLDLQNLLQKKDANEENKKGFW